MLEVKDLTVRYGGKTIVDSLSFSLSDGDWLMIAGPNGAGKSTVINAVMQSAPYTGQVLLCGENVKKMSGRALAKNLGVLAQNHYVGYAFSVEEVVRLGRYAFSPSPLKPASPNDDAAVEDALRLTGMLEKRAQSVLTLSGGELQRTFLAQLFAQSPRYLLLDEPTNHLDLIYQKQLFALIKNWLSQGERGVISVVHDLSLARAHGTRALLLKDGKAAALGLIQSTLNAANLEAVYGLDVFAYMREMLGQWEGR